jgi:uncharacterized protein
MKPAKLFAALLILSVCFGGQAANAANPDWPKALTIGTASPGGVYLPYGRFLAKLWTEKLHIPVDAVATQGPIHNIKLLDLGGAQIGLTTMGIALDGWNGAGTWTEGKRYQNMRALFPMYDTPFEATVLRRSDIMTLQQLDHKIVGVGPRAGTGGLYIPQIMNLLGIAADIKYGSVDDQATDLLAGQYAASSTMTGVPTPAWTRAESKEPLRFLTLSSEQIDAVLKKFPEISASTIPVKTYTSLDGDYHTFGVYNFAIARADLPDDLVYKLVKTLFENSTALAHDVTAASDTIPQNVSKDTFLPLHPGAIRYYREIGIKIPANLIPPS